MFMIKKTKALEGLLLVVFLFFTFSLKAQITKLPECNLGVPHFNIDLSSNPDSMYITPEVERAKQCCGNANSNENYVSFYVKAHPDVAMIEVDIYSGANPPGDAAKYNVITGGDSLNPGSCGALIDAGSPTCVTLDASGYLKVTYYKPGKNKNRYYFKQIPKPIFPQDDSTRVGCSLPIDIYGLNSITITSINSSTGNTTLGAYNSLLSCTNCSNPSFSPGLSTPAWIDYQISGTPIAMACGTYTSIDTVRLYTFGELSISALPNPASFCLGGSGVTLTATASGGNSVYSYKWRDSGGNVVSTTNTYLATTAGTYTAEVTDGLTSVTCPAEYVSVPVVIGNPPITNAGVDQTVCATSPTAFLSGTVQYATGGTWTGGNGVFNPSRDSLLTTYTPTATEIASGSVTLTLTSTGAGGGCNNSSDQVTISFSDSIFVNPFANQMVCDGELTEIFANSTGGTAPLKYYWSNGSTNDSITASAGTYSVMVSDFYGCAATSSITVSNPTPLILNLSSNNVSADSTCDGSASVAILGGQAPYAVLWNNGETSLTTSSTLCYGVYSVVVTDDNGCVVNGSVVVNSPTCSAFNVTANSTNVDCYNDSNGTATAKPNGGFSPYTYYWNSIPSQSNQTATNLSAGSYTVTVTDSVGCVDVAGVTILQPTTITNTITHIDVTSIGGSNGSATANPLGGTPPYQYLWTPGGQTTQTATNLNSAVGGKVYYLTISDDNSCRIQDSVLINQPPCNNFIVAVNKTDVSCNGSANGSAYIVIAHGTAPYQITWSHGPTNVTNVSGLAQGNYSVTVTDASNCTTFQNFTITEPDALSLSLVPTNVACFGDRDGTIDLTVSGGSFPYTYEWKTGGVSIAFHEDLVGLSPGTYSVRVTDENKCFATASIGITQPSKLSATYLYIDNLCNGYALGSINMTPTGGVLPYSYSWSGPSNYSNTTQDISGLSAGLYEFNFSDGGGCQSPLYQVYINHPDTIQIHHITVSCPNPGASTTIVTVDSLTGGTGGPFQISFDNQATFLPIGVYSQSLLVGSSYQVWAKDANGCISALAYPLTIDSNVKVDSVLFNPCVPIGATTIPVTVVSSGGDGAPYQVSTDGGLTWNPSGVYVINLPINSTFNITVKDLSGCIAENFSITIPAELNSTITLTNQVSCLGANDGSVNLTSTGGTVNYGYSWTGPLGFNSNLEDVTNLIAGTYYVTITDNKGCTKQDSILVTTVVDTTKPVITCIANQTVYSASTSCNYTQLGSAFDASATDNCIVTDLTYVLSGVTVGTGNTLNNVAFNTGVTNIVWTATDSLGNTNQCSFNVTVLDTVKPSIINCGAGNQTVNVDANECNYTQTTTAWDATASDNCTNVTITATLSGATTAIGSTTLSGVDFNTGITNVLWTVTDTSGNSVTCTYDITVIDNITPSIINCGAGDQTVNVDSNQCNYTQSTTAWDATASDNCTNVTITATLSGATIATGLTTLSGVDFNTGITNVLWTVTDTSGNSVTCSYDVTVIDNIVPSIINCGAGNQTIVADSGVCDYTHLDTSWDATATDNCTVSSVVYTLSGATSGSGTTLLGVTFNLGLTNVLWTVIDTVGNTDTCSYNVVIIDTELPIISNCPIDIIVNNDNDSCGTLVSWTIPTFTDNCGATMVSNYNSGDYFNVGITTVTYTVTDGSGNVTLCEFNVTVNDTQVPEAICNNPIATCDSLVVFSFPSVNDNCGILSVTQIAGLSSGSYFPVGTTTVIYEVIDIHNNTAQCSFDVTIHPTPIVVLNTEDVSCNGFNDGSIDLTVSNGTAPYSYAWSNLAITEDINSLAPDNYSVVVTDTNGCSATTQTAINEPTALSISGVDTKVKCFNESNGTIDVTVNGGILPYTYLWSNNEITEDVNGLTAGNYSVNVTDNNGCNISYSTTITQPDSLMIETVVYDATCNTNNGSIQAQVSGGTTPYVYNWTNGTTDLNLNNVVAGTYTMTVTDINLCTAQFTGTINSISNLIAEVSSTDVLCYGGNNGDVDVFVTSGNAPYTYLWSTGDTTALVNNLPIGNYDVTVTDIFGCQVNHTVTVNQPDSLFIELTVSSYLSETNISLYGENDGYINSTVFGGVTPYTYLWSNGSTEPEISDLVAGEYSLIVTDNKGCLAYAKAKLIQPLVLEMPSGFSPNLDGSNDYFVIKGVEAYPRNEITVFNRWGNIVYQKANYSNEWEGKNQGGEPLPDATYFVVFTAFGNEDITLKGYVDLRR